MDAMRNAASARSGVATRKQSGGAALESGIPIGPARRRTAVIGGSGAVRHSVVRGEDDEFEAVCRTPNVRLSLLC